MRTLDMSVRAYENIIIAAHALDVLIFFYDFITPRSLVIVCSRPKTKNELTSLNTLIIKKGEHGALLFNSEQMFFAPALPLEEVFDPTGAGDSFAGGFIGFLESKNQVDFNTMKQALIAGSALASFTVEAFGTQRLMTLTELEFKSRLKAFSSLTDYSAF